MMQVSSSSVKGAGGLHQVLRGQLRWVFIKFKGDRAGGLHQVLREQGVPWDQIMENEFGYLSDRGGSWWSW